MLHGTKVGWSSRVVLIDQLCCPLLGLAAQAHPSSPRSRADPPPFHLGLTSQRTAWGRGQARPQDAQGVGWEALSFW